VIPQQHAVERPSRGKEFAAVLREYDAIDQGADRLVGDADDVARAGRRRRLRSPVIALLVARRQRFRPGCHDDIEIPLPYPVLVLHVVDGSHGGFDAEAIR